LVNPLFTVLIQLALLSLLLLVLLLPSLLLSPRRRLRLGWPHHRQERLTPVTTVQFQSPSLLLLCVAVRLAFFPAAINVVAIVVL